MLYRALAPGIVDVVGCFRTSSVDNGDYVSLQVLDEVVGSTVVADAADVFLVIISILPYIVNLVNKKETPAPNYKVIPYTKVQGITLINLT